MEEISKIKKHLNMAEDNLTKNTEKINEALI